MKGTATDGLCSRHVGRSCLDSAGRRERATDVLADRLVRETALVPAIWPLEVGNALLVAVRRGRLSGKEMSRLASGLSALPVEVDPADGERAFGEVLDLAGKLDLSAYDAAYLELARRRQLPLATLDRRLRDACARLGVAVLPPRME